MLNAEFNKETFKNSVKENVKMLYRKNLEEASQQEIYQAVCYAVKDVIIDNWLKTQKAMDEQDPKILYYMSMEFLMGRALGNNLINLTAYKQVQEALDEMGLNLNLLEDQERDPALGNGGLGRPVRILMDVEEAGWDEAWEITTKTCAYTNHTIMAEALEEDVELTCSQTSSAYLSDRREINRRFLIQVREQYPGDEEKVRQMAVIYDGQVHMARLAIVGGYSVNGVAQLHTEILKKQTLKDFYEMTPEKFNNKTNGITQRRFLLHGNPLLADWVTEYAGDGWITDLPKIEKIAKLADDTQAQKEFMEIKYKNKVRLAKYIKEHNGIDVDPNSIFDVQVKRLHEYKRQFMNILHIMYLYDRLKKNPDMPFYPRTFIFGAKASAGYERAKAIIKLINSVGDVVNNDPTIKGKIKVVFIEDYRVSNAELIFAAADVSEQISTASKEASGTGNMKFMLNGALTLGTMDGANVEIVEEVGKENAFIFGLSADQVIEYENNYTYDPMSYFIHDQDIHNVVMDLISGRYSNGDTMMFRDLYDSLLTPKNAPRPDMYFTLADFKSYAAAQERVEDKYRNTSAWARSAILNTAHSGKFTSDRTIQQYVDDIWHLDKITVRK